MLRTRVVRALLTGCASFLLTGGVAAAADFTPGSSGLGDPFFPNAGNGGYDVANYDLKLAYDPATDVLDGKAVVTATATQDLSSFDLDLRGFQISKLTVNGVAATFTRDGQELVITPRDRDPERLDLPRRRRLQRRPGGDRRSRPVDRGLDPHRRRRLRRRRAAGLARLVSVQRQPARQGDVRLRRHRAGGPDGDGERRPRLVDDERRQDDLGLEGDRPDGDLPRHVDARQASTCRSRRRRAGCRSTSPSTRSSRRGRCSRSSSSRSISTRRIYGPYPFNAVGAIVDSAKVVGYSLETQTKPNFPFVPDEATLVHEISHMWFGDSVTLTEWPDIWLHEGFATWSEWIWSEYQGNKSAAQCFKQLYSTPAKDTAFWNPPPATPGTPALPLQRDDLLPRRDDAAGAAGEGRRLHVLPDHPRLGDAEPLRQRDDAAVHRARGADLGPGPDGLLRRLALPGGQADELVSHSGG